MKAPSERVGKKRHTVAISKPSSRIAVIEIASWALVFTAAALAGALAFLGSDAEGDENAYRWGYAAISTILSPLLAAILVFPFLPKTRHARLRFVSVGSPAFLLAILLHVSLWGVLASRWLAVYHPLLGSSLWAFMLTSSPLAVILSATYFIKVGAIRKGAVLPGDRPERVEARPAEEAGWRRRWFSVASVLFFVQFLAIAIGAFLTASNALNHWYTSEVTAWTHGIVLLDISFLVGALAASTLMLSRVATWRGASAVGSTEPGVLGSGSARAFQARRIWLIALGPLIVGSILLFMSLAGLLFSDFMRADYRLNTGIMLFVSYSSSVLPSYAILSFLHLIGARSLPLASAVDEMKGYAATEN